MSELGVTFFSMQNWAKDFAIEMYGKTCTQFGEYYILRPVGIGFQDSPTVVPAELESVSNKIDSTWKLS